MSFKSYRLNENWSLHNIINTNYNIIDEEDDYSFLKITNQSMKEDFNSRGRFAPGIYIAKGDIQIANRDNFYRLCYKDLI